MEKRYSLYLRHRTWLLLILMGTNCGSEIWERNTENSRSCGYTDRVRCYSRIGFTCRFCSEHPFQRITLTRTMEKKNASLTSFASIQKPERIFGGMSGQPTRSRNHR